MAKPIRLSKAASEYKIGISTIVEYLEKKGQKIDPNPNTKLEPHHVELLNQEFFANLEPAAASVEIPRRDKREVVSLEDKVEEKPAKVIKEELDEDDFDIEKIKEEIKGVTPNYAKLTPKPEIASPVPTPDSEKVEPVKIVEEEPSVDSSPHQLKVVDKIDLSSLNQKTRPDKRKPEPKKEVRVEPKPEVKTQATPENKEEPKVESVKEEIVPVAPQVIETIRVKSQTLSGPTVLGKIDLPVEKPKTINNPNQNSAGGDPKKKRKRIKKADFSTGSNNSGGNNSGGNNQSGNNQGQNRFNKNNNNNRPQGANAGTEKKEVSEQDIQREIKETLARLSNQGSKSKASKNRRQKRDNFAQRRQEEMAAMEAEEKTLKLTEFVTVSELASMMNVPPTKVISACMSLGIFASINQRLDAETIQIVADEFGYETEFVSAEVQDAITVVEDKPEDLVSRPPIITVMGHVDHGKTSLLDKIRNANVTAGEAGGITQHIGAYSVTLKDGRKMTFLDTPGHEAFTAMRARGAQVTDVAIIIVAADDDVMPQTKEAISHAQAAGVPMIFAINKIDKPGANADNIRRQLSEMNILVEDWGGKYQVQEISAKQNINIDLLLEKVLLEAEVLDLKANPNKNALGTVIESSLDKGKGYVTNMLVEAGTLKIGDVILVGRHYGRVRAMHDEKGNSLKTAGPATPVSILGIGGAPSAGDKFNVMDDEKEAKSIATKREQLYREQGLRTTKHITLDEIGRRLAIGDFKELNVIVKGDVDGSIEALSDALLNLSTEEIQVNIIHKGVGAISEADVNLASASDAIIIGFQVRPSVSARKLAENEQIDIRLYSVIYKAIEELKAAMEGMLSPDIEEKILGSAEIRETFNITKVGTIAGCYVLDGIIKRSSKVRVIRDGIVVHSGVLGSLKRFKDDVKEVKNNYECGLNIDKFNDIQIGDIVEAYEEVEVARKL